jgi:hypothetical protein
MKSLILLSAFCCSLTAIGQVGIGTNTPHSSAVLDVESSVKGFLPPRLTTEQRDAITDPAVGLIIYNSSIKCLEFYTNDSGSGNNADDWTNVCNHVHVQDPQSAFDSLTVKMVNITDARLLTADSDEPEVPNNTRVGYNLTTCFDDWLADAFDVAGWIFLDQPNVTDISSANLLPYTTAAGQTGGTLGNHAVLGGNQYFTNFSTNRKIFSFWAQTGNNTSIKFVSDSGIDAQVNGTISGNTTSTNGKYRIYYQTVDATATNDAWLTHIFFVKESQASSVTFSSHNTNLGSTIGNQTNTVDDISGILVWPNAGDVTEVYGFMMVFGQNHTSSGPKPTIAELEAMGNKIVDEVLP